MSARLDESYLDKAAAVAAGVQREVAQVIQFAEKESRFGNSYHLADANLRYFFPQLGSAQSQALISDILFQQRMAEQDQSDFDLIDATCLDDPAGMFEPGRAGQGRIYCTYHAGSYRHLFHFLARAGIDCLLLVAGPTLAAQGASFVQLAKAWSEARGWTGKLALHQAEDPNSLLYAARALKRGMSVVVYIDGNVGVGANRHSTNLVTVDFFGKEILARSGIAFLSHLANVPVVPVICSRAASQALTLRVLEAISPGKTPRDDYLRATTNALYAALEKQIAATPAQWEGWLYIEKFLKRRAALPARVVDDGRLPRMPGALLKANADHFALLVYATQPVLLDKKKHSFVMLDGATAQLFREAAKGAIDAVAHAGHAGVQQLLALGALE